MSISIKLKNIWYSTYPIRRWRGWQYIGWVQIVGLLLFIVVALAIIQRYQADWQKLWNDLFSNFATEVLSIAFTVLVLDTLSKMRSDNERKRAVIRQVGSPVHDAAIEAVRIARLEEWLLDGAFERAYLGGANLQGANLSYTNLERASLTESNLQGTDLHMANLQKTKFMGSNLHDANLVMANLQGADLEETNLQGTNLAYANLQKANLLNATFDENTTLPDETLWSLDTDLSHFTNTDHPDFWPSFSYRDKGKPMGNSDEKSRK